MDTIIISDLAVACRVGITEAERAHPQRLLITLEIDCDVAAAAESDDLTRTIDYAAVCRRLLSIGDGRSWKLIETLATDIANLVQSEFHAPRLSVEVRKFIIPEARYVAVRMIRPLVARGAGNEAS
jgi:dihydroneopterin aldolase